ncbi:MAG: hypothetical protein EOO99_09915 [Pedobacter sp.]|nr:MAG: hypothetical protein EOO99_09915 [Pedobacter sp.]
MKKLLYLLTFVILGTGSAYSQIRPREKQNTIQRSQSRNQDMVWMQRNLKLSPKQVAEIRKLNQDKFRQSQKLRHANIKHLKKNRIQRAAQLKNQRAKLQKILTKEQFLAYQKFQVQKRERLMRGSEFHKFQDKRELPRAERQRSPRGSR